MAATDPPETSRLECPERDGVPLFGRCVRGLEWVLVSEVQAALAAEVDQMGHRQVRFRTGVDLAAVLDLRCADDVFVDCGTVPEVARDRASLGRLAAGLGRLDLAGGLARVTALRGRASASFDVVCSFVGKRNYNRYEAEDAAAAAIAKATGLARVDPERRDAAEVTWRVHMEGETAVVGVRLGETPLHRRAYRTRPRPGALHPPVAAAMAVMAELAAGHVVVDPQCGSGTICVEAKAVQPGAVVAGSDIDGEAVRTSAAHGLAATADVAWLRADAAHLPWTPGRADRVLCNPAWGRVVAPQGALGADPGRFAGEVDRLLAAGGRALILLDEDAGDLGGGGDLRETSRVGLRVAGRRAAVRTLERA